MRFKCICPIFLTANVIQIHSHFKKKNKQNTKTTKQTKQNLKNPEDEKRAAQ